MANKFLFFGGLIFWSLTVHAQTSQVPQLHFNYLGVKDGLPEGTVNDLLQDTYGYMWIGTQSGIVRYDGYSAKVYNPRNRAGQLADIIKIFEDRNKELWIGTSEAQLCRFDRSSDSFVSYKLPAQKYYGEGLYYITGIQDDQTGNIWITLKAAGKDTGFVSVFNPVTRQFEVFSRYEKGNHYVNAGVFYKMVLDKKGSVWIGSDNGLYNCDEANHALKGYFAQNAPGSKNTVTPFITDTIHDEMWIDPGARPGVWRWDMKNNKIESYKRSSAGIGLENDSITNAFKDSRGQIWLSTYGGLSLFDRTSNGFINYTPNDARANSLDKSIFSINEDRDHNLWCKSDYGLLLFNTKNNRFNRYVNDDRITDGLVGSDIQNIIFDHSGLPWFGADQLGLQWLNTSRSRFTLYKDNPGNPHNFNGGQANSFAEAMDGTFWVGSDYGLYHWLPQTDSFIQVAFSKRPKSVYVNSVVVDKDGLVWCRAFGDNGNVKGLYSYDPKTNLFKNYRYKEGDSTSLSSDIIRAILADHNGIIWIGTFGGGICSFDKRTQKFTRRKYILNAGFNNTSSLVKGALDDDQVQTIYEDSTGTLWIGTNNGNLNRYNRETGMFTSWQNKIPGFTCVLDVLNDNKGTIWAGTYISGLYSFNQATNTYKNYSEANGLLYDGAWGINEDKNGNIWIASLRGISILNTRTGKFRNLSAANGLPENPLGFFLFKTGRGMFIIGCKSGFITLDPDDFTADSVAPVVHVESIAFTTGTSGKINDSLIPVFGKTNIRLKYNQNRITFNYVGLQYQSGGLVKYAYELAGYDKNWINTGTQRQVTYTNLSPGTYTFKVRAANSDGLWSNAYDSIVIVISPPWWRTVWAYIFYGLCFLSLVIFTNRMVRSRIIEKEKIKIKETELAHAREIEKAYHDLKITQSQLIQSEKMASLGELTAGIAHEIQNPLNFVNNFSEVNGELIDELQDEAGKGNIEEVKAIAKDIKANEEKINHHGKRADSIVKGMLQHSRASSGLKELTDINALVDEYLRLSYHGLRAKDKSFNATLRTDFDNSAGNINIVPQDIGRVLLNLFTNAFYAVAEKEKQQTGLQSGNEKVYEPAVLVNTKRINGKIEITVSDNGNGIPQKVLDKIFQPFFTTKPTGKGTGLGLSLSYDIIKTHGGEIRAETAEGKGAEFIILLPAA